VEFKGKACTLYPLGLTGAVIPDGYDPAPFVAAYQENLTKLLTKAGLEVTAQVPGVADQELIVTGQLVRFEKGSRWMSVLFMFGALGGLLAGLVGGSVFEVQGALGNATSPFVQIHSVGKMSFVTPWGKNVSGIKSAAKVAATLTSRQVTNALKAR
jgi:hypothetical protein